MKYKNTTNSSCIRDQHEYKTNDLIFYLRIYSEVQGIKINEKLIIENIIELKVMMKPLK